MSAKPSDVSLQALDTFVAPGKGVVLIDFWAPWCGPCKVMGPILDQISAEYDGRLAVGKVNVDVEPDLAAQFNIRGIPTLVMFRDGQVISQAVGAVPKDALKRWIDQAF